jgi:hypothetical protein
LWMVRFPDFRHPQVLQDLWMVRFPDFRHPQVLQDLWMVGRKLVFPTGSADPHRNCNKNL